MTLAIYCSSVEQLPSATRAVAARHPARVLNVSPSAGGWCVAPAPSPEPAPDRRGDTTPTEGNPE